jgi:hypothetical protein
LPAGLSAFRCHTEVNHPNRRKKLGKLNDSLYLRLELSDTLKSKPAWQLWQLKNFLATGSKLSFFIVIHRE